MPGVEIRQWRNVRQNAARRKLNAGRLILEFFLDAQQEGMTNAGAFFLERKLLSVKKLNYFSGTTTY
jgi:hypothetical protein